MNCNSASQKPAHPTHFSAHRLCSHPQVVDPPDTTGLLWLNPLWVINVSTRNVLSTSGAIVQTKPPLNAFSFRWRNPHLLLQIKGNRWSVFGEEFSWIASAPCYWWYFFFWLCWSFHMGYSANSGSQKRCLDERVLQEIFEEVGLGGY